MKAKPSETSVMHHNNGSSLQRIFQAPIRWTWCSWRNLEFLFILDVYNVGKAVKQSIFNPSLTTKKEGPTWSNYGMLWVVYDMAQFHRSSSMSKLSHFFTCDFVAQWLRQGLLKHFIHSGTSWRYHGDPWGSMGIHGDPMIREKPQAGGWGGSPMALGWTNWPMEVYPTFKHSPDFQGGECELTDDQSTNWGGSTKELGQWVTRNDQLCGFDLGLPEIFWFIITFPIKSPSLEYHYNIPDFQRPVC